MIIRKVQIQEGKLILEREEFAKEISYQKDGDYLLTIKKIYKNRTIPQNSYYWGKVVEDIVNAINASRDVTNRVDKDGVHEFLTQEFAPNKDLGDGMQIKIRTHEMDTVQFEQYLSDCRQWAAIFLGIYIEEPNEDDLPPLPEQQ